MNGATFAPLYSARFAKPVAERSKLKKALVHYRESTLIKRYPRAKRVEGILRRNMLEAILEARPETKGEFFALPSHLLMNTDPQQIQHEIEPIVRMVRTNR